MYKGRVRRLSVSSLLFTCACTVTSHPVDQAKIGVVRSSEAFFAVLDQPDVWNVETIVSADWSIDRAGLINLDNATAKAANLKDGLEPIQIFFHALRHPKHGLFIVDTGVERKLRDDPENAALSGMAADALGTDRMQVRLPLADFLSEAGQPLKGVFMTHLHADHVLGAPDVPNDVPFYIGRGEAGVRALMNIAAQPLTNALFEGKSALRELPYAPDKKKRFHGLVDVFGDSSFWALYVPGHTDGSLAFVARTIRGPVLLTGDTCHTAWGWQNDVEPGSFTADREKNRESLGGLRRLVREHPTISVRLGHQSLSN